MEREFKFKYLKYNSLCEMPLADVALVEKARAAMSYAYAPFSEFRVAAAAQLSSGEVAIGVNVESEVYPAGMCAERNLLFSIVANHPKEIIHTIAITSEHNSRECTPCGMCRQSLLDAERRQQSPIRIIMCSGTSATVVDSAELLLPFSFKL